MLNLFKVNYYAQKLLLFWKPVCFDLIFGVNAFMLLICCNLEYSYFIYCRYNTFYICVKDVAFLNVLNVGLTTIYNEK